MKGKGVAAAAGRRGEDGGRREWCPDEGERALRLSIRAWQALLRLTRPPDSAKRRKGGAGSTTLASAAATTPVENFLERGCSCGSSNQRQ